MWVRIPYNYNFFKYLSSNFSVHLSFFKYGYLNIKLALNDPKCTCRTVNDFNV